MTNAPTLLDAARRAALDAIIERLCLEAEILPQGSAISELLYSVAEDLEEWRDAIAAEAGGGGWSEQKPIDEAPRDGTRVDLWMKLANNSYCREPSCWWEHDRWWRMADNGGPIPLHRQYRIKFFSHIPPPPTEGRGGG